MASSSSTFTSLQPSILPSEPLPWRPSTSPKLPPGALLDIADDLLWDLFTEWLHIEDVCHLDSALCQKRRRPYFLHLLATKVLIFNREEINVLTNQDYDPYQDDPFTHKALGAAALNWVLKRGINLASLHLPQYLCGMNAAEKQSIREAVAALALDGRLDKLETISLYVCNYIKDADLVASLSKGYRSMKSIDIRYCGLTESAAVHIKCCTKLEAFSPKGNESATEMAEIFQACRKLRKVDLSGFRHRLTDEVVYCLAENCHLLEYLNLLYSNAVSDAAIRRVVESCPLLQLLDVSFTSITDATVVALSKQSPLLKRMFFIGCINLTDAAVLAVAERLSGLTHIDLAGVTAITSSAVETLASKCRELEYIRLTNCHNVSDSTLIKIAEHCSKLRVLHVEGCRNVSDAALIKIANHCSKLRVLHVRGCPNVTSVGVDEIRSKCSKVVIYGFEDEEENDENEEEDNDEEGDEEEDEGEDEGEDEDEDQDEE